MQPGGSPYHTIHPADTSLEGWNFQNLKQNRSNSWSESLDDLKIVQDASSDTGRSSRVLNETNTVLYDNYKKAYAEVLHRWRLLDGRAQVLKHVSGVHPDTHKDVEFQSECQICMKTSRGPQCSNCKRLTFQCVICNISVRGETRTNFNSIIFLRLLYNRQELLCCLCLLTLSIVLISYLINRQVIVFFVLSVVMVDTHNTLLHGSRLRLFAQLVVGVVVLRKARVYLKCESCK